MASNKSAALMLATKLPPPDKLDELDEDNKPEDTKDEDEGGDEAAKVSAFEDFLSAIGVSTKKAEAGMKAFDHYMGLCGHEEHSDNEDEEM